MEKDLIKLMIKEMFKNGELRIQVQSENSDIFDCINTTVNVWLDGEVISSSDY